MERYGIICLVGSLFFSRETKAKGGSVTFLIKGEKTGG